jgi:hypothetical protein
MKSSLRVVTVVFLLLALAIVSPGLASPVPQQNDVTSPEEFFGFQLGSDRKLARWDRIVEYFELLENESDKIDVIDMGPSTEGNPFLLVIITSADNLDDLENLRQINHQLTDPRGLTQEQVRELVDAGKVVISQSMSLHATEVGGTQMAPELAYDLVSRDDEETLRILDNVIYLMFPSFNPDGQIMVTDWYDRWLGTEYEAAGLPWLYHKYAGHDNNRDGDFLNLAESVHIAKVIYRDWHPQAYVDHHHMGSYGARFYVPPYSEPIRPYADPLVWREMSWYGAHIAYKLEEAGKTGILNVGQYPGWGHFGWHWITPFHNMAGMLTESASARLATPLYIQPDQLHGGARQFPEYEEQTTIPSLWPGGWWRLRDVVEQQKIAAWATLDIAARSRETVLWNAYLKGKRQTERGAEGTPKAYVVPAMQHDHLTAVKMINTLMLSDIEIHEAQSDFTAGGVTYGAGSFLIPLAQPKMGLIRNLLGQTFYPDNEWTRARDGRPLRPYDSATHTMNEFMGVRVDPVDKNVDGDFQRLTAAVPTPGSVAAGTSRYLLDGRMNASFKAVNLLLDAGVDVRRVEQASADLRPGDFVVEGGSGEVLDRVAAETGVDFQALAQGPSSGIHDVQRMRVGMYQRYRGGNMDEGWTRLLLEQFDFPYTTLMDAEIKAGGLRANYDVIIVPNDSTAAITGQGSERYYGGSPPAYPPEYVSGIGDEGVEALKAFVEDGGTLVALGAATDFAIEKFSLGVRNAMEGLDSIDFFCPGSTLRASFDNTNPLAYGMPQEGLVLFWSSPAFEILPSDHSEDYQRVVVYADRDLLRSGWLIGEEHLANKAGMVSVKYGEGSVVLIGFRTQNRAQTHGTFKLLFNALLR